MRVNLSKFQNLLKKQIIKFKMTKSMKIMSIYDNVKKFYFNLFCELYDLL
jgi:hypothetical protein